jgi:hypothetical protein
VTHRRFETVARSGPVTVQGLGGAADTLVIAFASIGHDATRAPSPEFVASSTAQDRPALFVLDEGRSWGLSPDFATALRAAVAGIRARQSITRIVTLGQSMGGHCALRAARLIPVDATLAFGPQWNPRDPRWRPWTDHLPPDPPPVGQAGWTVLMHAMADDAEQALPFPQAAGIDHILFDGLTHSALCPHLKARGVLQGLTDALATGDRRRLIRLATGAGGRRRQLPR